jgi:hypothetical protein
MIRSKEDEELFAAIMVAARKAVVEQIIDRGLQDNVDLALVGHALCSVMLGLYIEGGMAAKHSGQIAFDAYEKLLSHELSLINSRRVSFERTFAHGRA